MPIYELGSAALPSGGLFISFFIKAEAFFCNASGLLHYLRPPQPQVMAFN
ncbi:hypothetical protein [uncultured Flavobacterium sp.]|nr:hypothetical protein [uncultured Flavobacterium sp.]